MTYICRRCIIYLLRLQYPGLAFPRRCTRIYYLHSHLLQFEHGRDLPIGSDSPDEVVVSDVDGAVRSGGQGLGPEQLLLESRPIRTIPGGQAVQRSLVTRAHDTRHDHGLVLEVDGVTVAFLKDPGVEVVLVDDVQLPVAKVRVSHVVSAQLRRLDVPQDEFIFAVVIVVVHVDVVAAAALAVGAVPVFVADLHGGRGDAVDTLE